MNSAVNNAPSLVPPAGNAKPLWAAVGILGVAVIGMGGTMIYQGRSTPPVAFATPTAQVASLGADTAKPGVAGSAARSSNGGSNVADDMIEKPSAAPAKPAPLPHAKVVKPPLRATPSVSPQSTVVGTAPAALPIPAPVAAVIAPICSNCGAVESVTPLERTTKADGPGVGAVAGGVAGAVLGSQVGSGNGRTAATILGAIGGGLAGNAIEKNMKKETVYQVNVRMEDGSRRTAQVSQAPAVGSKVTFEGTGLRTDDGMIYRAAAPVGQRAGQSQPNYQAP